LNKKEKKKTTIQSTIQPSCNLINIQYMIDTIIF